MALSAESIKHNVDIGLLGIEPFNEANLKGASYSFTLGSTLRRLEPGQIAEVGITPRYEEVSIREGGFLLGPGEFVLGTTVERLSLNGRFTCLLSNRGSCAQLGLDILLGSTLAEPDTDCTQTLEIKNAGPVPIRLVAGMSIVKGLFLTLE